ncbi:hypothetical protein J3Q64DRAFT_1726206 [Phycomyces blakesleeanus]
MATQGHGPSQSTCDQCYTINIIPITSPNSLLTVQITGPVKYQGILLQVKNELNQTVGMFTDYSDSDFAPVACDDEAGDENFGVLGHSNPSPKSWPFNVGWTIETIQSKTQLRVQGMVVIDYDNYHVLPETPFKIKRVPTISKPTTSTLDTSTVLEDLPTKDKNYPTLIDKEDPFVTLHTPTPTLIVEAPQFVKPKQPNQLFFQVLCLVFGMYLIMSFGRCQYRRKKRSLTTSSVDQEAQQSLVSKYA